MAKKALKEAPDLILLDVNLPGIDGLHICEQIRKTSQIPIIFVTGNNTSMDELNCMLRGGDDYVAKPYQLPVLMARIAAVISAVIVVYAGDQFVRYTGAEGNGFFYFGASLLVALSVYLLYFLATYMGFKRNVNE